MIMPISCHGNDDDDDDDDNATAIDITIINDFNMSVNNNHENEFVQKPTCPVYDACMLRLCLHVECLYGFNDHHRAESAFKVRPDAKWLKIRNISRHGLKLVNVKVPYDG